MSHVQLASVLFAAALLLVAVALSTAVASESQMVIKYSVHSNGGVAMAGVEEDKEGGPILLDVCSDDSNEPHQGTTIDLSTTIKQLSMTSRLKSCRFSHLRLSNPLFSTVLRQLLQDTASLQSLSIVHLTSPLNAALESNAIQELAPNKYLSQLDLSFNDLSAQSIKSLCLLLPTFHALQTLVLDGNPLNSSYLRSLIHALRKHHSLQHLSLSSCKLDNSCAKLLGIYLKSQSGLAQLDLSQNEITGEGIVGLFGALTHGSNLKALDLSHNALGDAGLASLGRAIANNHFPELRELTIRQVGASSHGLSEFLQLIPSDNHLVSLDLSGNKLFVSKKSERLVRTKPADQVMKLFKTSIAGTWKSLNSIVTDTDNNKGSRKRKGAKKNGSSKRKKVEIEIAPTPEIVNKKCLETLRSFLDRSKNLRNLVLANVNIDSDVIQDLSNKSSNNAPTTIPNSDKVHVDLRCNDEAASFRSLLLSI